MIPEYIKQYLNSLISAYPSINSIWLIGSRANPPYKSESDWDLFAFADLEIFKQLQDDLKFKRDDVDFLVVYDGNHFKSLWPRPGKTTKAGTLFPSSESCRNFDWKLLSDAEATYLGTESTGNGGWNIVERRAYRVYRNQ